MQGVKVSILPIRSEAGYNPGYNWHRRARLARAPKPFSPRSPRRVTTALRSRIS